MAWYWQAPESIQSRIVTCKSDVWSFGVCMYEIFSDTLPCKTSETMQRFYRSLLNGYRLPQPMHCPDEVYATMQLTWMENPNTRPNMAQLGDTIASILAMN